jgi:hypothetical protein
LQSPPMPRSTDYIGMRFDDQDCFAVLTFMARCHPSR